MSDDVALLNIRRMYIWEHYIAAKKRFNIPPEQKVRIIFIGEPAVDDGGLKREFLSGKMPYILMEPVVYTLILCRWGFKH